MLPPRAPVYLALPTGAADRPLLIADGPCTADTVELTAGQGATSLGVAGATSAKQFRGLRNQGATCYMNSLLQTLYMTPEVRKCMYSWKYDADVAAAEEDCIPLQLQRLFGMLQLSTESAVTTRALTHSFGWTGADAFTQHDVQELMRVLLDALEKDVDDEAISAEITQLFGGQLEDYVRSATEEDLARFHQTDAWDAAESGALPRPPLMRGIGNTGFQDLALVIKPFGATVAVASVEEALAQYIKPELMAKDNMVNFDLDAQPEDGAAGAEPASMKLPAIKGLKIATPPPLLTLQLKRFDLDYTSPYLPRIKLNDRISFPPLLNLNKFVGTDVPLTVAEIQEAQLPAAVASEWRDAETGAEKDAIIAKHHANIATKHTALNATAAELVQTQGEHVYELYSVMVHSGGATGGHYYAYIKDVETRDWYNFNDSSVTPITWSQVTAAFGGKSNGYYGSASAYMLMYRAWRPGGPEDGAQAEFPADEHVPDSVRAEVAKAEEVARQIEEDRKRAANSLRLRLWWRQADGKLVTEDLGVQRDDTITGITQAAYELAGMAERGVDRDDVQLYEWIASQELTGKPIPEVDAMGDPVADTPSSLRWYAYQALMLQTREPGTQWPVYDPRGVPLRVKLYTGEGDTAKARFSSAVYVRVNLAAALAQLKRQVSQDPKLGIPVAECRVLKCTATGHSGHRTVNSAALVGDHLSLSAGFGLHQHDELIVERVPEEQLAAWEQACRAVAEADSTPDSAPVTPVSTGYSVASHSAPHAAGGPAPDADSGVIDSETGLSVTNAGWLRGDRHKAPPGLGRVPIEQEQSNAATDYCKMQYEVTVTLSVHDPKAPIGAAYTAGAKRIQVYIDSRKTIGELRTRASEVLGIPTHELNMKRGSAYGTALTEDATTLARAFVVDNCVIIVEQGLRLEAGQFLAHVSLLRAPVPAGLRWVDGTATQRDPNATSVTNDAVLSETVHQAIGPDGWLPLPPPEQAPEPAPAAADAAAEEGSETVATPVPVAASPEAAGDAAPLPVATSPASGTSNAADADVKRTLHGVYPPEISTEKQFLFGMPVSRDMPVSQVRERVLAHLVENELVPTGTPADHVRIRGQLHNGVADILKGKVVSDNFTSFHDRMPLMVQILAEPEELRSAGATSFYHVSSEPKLPRDVLCTVQWWDSARWAVTAPREMVCDANSPLSQFLVRAGAAAGVPAEHLRFVTLGSGTISGHRLHLYEWQTMGSHRATQTGSALYMKDGYRVLLHDDRLPVAELSPAELAQLNPYGSTTSYVYYPGGSSVGGSSTWSRRERGLKIRTREDRLRDAAAAADDHDGEGEADDAAGASADTSPAAAQGTAPKSSSEPVPHGSGNRHLSDTERARAEAARAQVQEAAYIAEFAREQALADDDGGVPMTDLFDMD